MLKYNNSEYIGRQIQLYPGDTISKWGVIEGVDDLGFTIKITKVNGTRYNDFQEGKTYFLNHAKNITFMFVD